MAELKRRSGPTWPFRHIHKTLVSACVALLLLSACQSPDEYEIPDDAASPTMAATEPAQVPTEPGQATNPPGEATATPAQVPPEAATATSEPTATDVPAPTATGEPTATPEPPAASTPTPTEDVPPSADEVWNLHQFDTDEQVMVLTFDAGADVGFATEILDLLAAEGIHASFGMTGPWAEDNPDLIQRMVDEGHHLINHSWSHPDFTDLTTSERVAEILSLESLIRDMTGVELAPYFRPPFGAYDDATLVDLATHDYTINVMWTIDTLGWNGLTAEEINARVLDGAAPGAIVLMHVGSQSQDAAALPEMIRMLREQGYSFASVADLVE